MAIVKMKKLSVIGMNEEKQNLLRELMDFGAVEIASPEDKLRENEWKKLVVKDGDEESVAKFDTRIANAQTALDILKEYADISKPLFATRKRVTESEYQKILQNEELYERHVHELTELSNHLNEIFAEMNQTAALVASLEPWKAYDIPLEMIETESLKLKLGIVPPETEVDDLSKKLVDAGCTCALEELGKDKEQKYLSLWYFKEEEEKVLDIVKSHGYSVANLGKLTGTVSENIKNAISRNEKLSAEKEECINSIKERADYDTSVKYYHDIMIIKRDRAQVRSKLLMTDCTFSFDGWIPEASEGKIQNLLKNYVCWYDLSEPKSEDDVPVKLKNKQFFSPIEFITEMYSLPSWKEIDPTAIFTMFYIVFFGIMFGDIGYGILLCLGSAIMLKKGKLYEGNAYKLLKVLFYSGVSSIFWGFMFGSFFGDLIPVVAETFLGKEMVINPMWLDPAKEPMIFLVFSCGLGIVHLFVGMGIKAYELIRDGQFLIACKDVFAWYLIVAGIVLWLFGGKVAVNAPHIGKIMTLIGVIAALVLPFVVNKGMSKAIGIWDLYSGITGNLSDILSYSRLLGLGLASTSIAQVFNFLASMGGKGVVGAIIFIIIALLGHGLNFAINALGAFVHSCRLQYVEFFGRFFEGDGREFKPFNKNTKYINVIKEVK